MSQRNRPGPTQRRHTVDEIERRLAATELRLSRLEQQQRQQQRQQQGRKQ